LPICNCVILSPSYRKQPVWFAQNTPNGVLVTAAGLSTPAPILTSSKNSSSLDILIIYNDFFLNSRSLSA
jgi:hypothetical protein